MTVARHGDNPTCCDFVDRLQEYLDGGPTVNRSALEEHAAACPACQGWLNAAQLLADGLRCRPALEPRHGFAERVVSQVLLEQADAARTRRRLWGAAIAAGVGFVLLAGYGWLRPRPAAPTAVDSAVVAVAPTHPPQAKRGLSLADSVSEARSALNSIVSVTTEETLDPGRFLLPDKIEPISVPSVENWEQALVAAPQSLREAGQGVSAGLEPVAQSARRAVQVFLDELPPMGSQ